MTEQDDNTEVGAGHPNQALLYCLVAVVLAVSLIGFLRGIDVSKEEMSSHVVVSSPPEGTVDESIPVARSYTEMKNQPPGPGSGWEQSLELSKHKPREGKVSAEDLKTALLKRERTRAYEGAPPTIPHKVAQSSAAECMACHGQQLKLGERIAQGLPHDNFTSCTQCHVTREDPMPGGGTLESDPRAVTNSFQGLKPKARGPKAWEGAPPQIPHSTFMRENCLACHGESASVPMQSTHTERKSCTQCHASSAELDQRPDMSAWGDSP